MSNAAGSSDPEARIIHALLVVLGTARVVISLALHEAIGAEVTVALVLAVLGAVGMLRSAH